VYFIVMSFGYSVGDGLLLVQLAWSTIQGARRACGEYDELTVEVSSLHRVLQRLQQELTNPDSPVNRADDDRRQELDEFCVGAEQILKVMNAVLVKYNALADDKRSGKKLWQKIQFGNGETRDLVEIRQKLSVHTSAILMSLNLCSLGSLGRVENRLNNVDERFDGIERKVDWVVANMVLRNGEGSVWTSYADDEKPFWRELRHELVQEGFPSSALQNYKGLIKAYVKELGKLGVFDENIDEENASAGVANTNASEQEVGFQNKNSEAGPDTSPPVLNRQTVPQQPRSEHNHRDRAEETVAPSMKEPKISSTSALRARIDNVLDEDYVNSSTSHVPQASIQPPRHTKNRLVLRDTSPSGSSHSVRELVLTILPLSSQEAISSLRNLDAPAVTVLNLRRYNPLYTYFNFSHWDLREELIPVAGNILDVYSLSRWIHCWALFKWGENTMVKALARLFGDTIIQFAKLYRGLEACLEADTYAQFHKRLGRALGDCNHVWDELRRLSCSPSENLTWRDIPEIGYVNSILGLTDSPSSPSPTFNSTSGSGPAMDHCEQISSLPLLSFSTQAVMRYWINAKNSTMLFLVRINGVCGLHNGLVHEMLPEGESNVQDSTLFGRVPSTMPYQL
jgi:hypothetical protein